MSPVRPAMAAEGDMGIDAARTPFETDRLDNLETLRMTECVHRAAGVEIQA